MAKIYKTNGEVIEISSTDEFNLNFLKSVVGGWIEVVYLANDKLMVVNEEGKLLHLPYNHLATEVARSQCSYIGNDWIAGDALVCDKSQIK